MQIPQSQPFSSPEDLERMLDLLRRCRAEKRSAEFPTPADLCELLAQPNVQADTRLWLAPGGSAAAFALVDPYNNLLFEVDAHAGSPALEQELVAWGLACVNRRAQPGRPQPTLDASCMDSDRARISWLARNGFVRQAVQTLHLERELTSGLPPPNLPHGFKLRALNGDAEVGAWVDLHQAAHDTSFMTIEERQAMMAHPGYDPELDLVIESADGRLAAYCLCTIDSEENERTGRRVGATDPVATHPDFQRRGLAIALLLAAMHLLKERGIDAAAMSTTSANLPMLAAASKAGYRIVSRRFWYSHSG